MAGRAALCSTNARNRAGGALHRLAPGRHRRSGHRAVNLLSPLPDAGAAEQTETVLTRLGLRIERIVSLGQASPPGFWYDQAEGEWVLVLARAAKLRVADETDVRLLRPGDWVDIAPRRRHRVDWTDPATPTVWLPIFYRQSPLPSPQRTQLHRSRLCICGSHHSRSNQLSTTYKGQRETRF